MTTLQGTLNLDRTVLAEVTEDPNVTPVVIVAGSAGSASGGSASLGKTDTLTQSGEFRQYGNGNTRLILGSGQSRTQTLVLRLLTPTQLQQVMDLTGHTVVYRDTYGRRIFGAFLELSMTTIPFSGGLTDVGLVVQSVTYDEAV